MPTPVSSARQCLTPEAAFALDEAVAVARRRGHAQTMSLHAVSSLFALPNSALREACARARNSAYSPRLQFKALELSLSVSLDRIPSARPPVDEPPVSNSLMAAIKRSQANQKRHPENYHVYHQIQLQQQSGSAVSCVKVELQHLILAMLDDPVVSRVFGEAGFRSCDIKMAVIRPLPRFIGYSRSKAPPLFLSNLNKDASFGVGNLGFQLRASGGLPDADGSHKRICEVLVKNKGRNPLLVGVCACNALKSFTESLEQRNQISLPVELCGLTTICIENEMSKFVWKNCNDSALLNLRLGEIAEMVAGGNGQRLIVDIGGLNSLILEHAPIDSLNHIIKRVTKLLATHVGKLWLIGSVPSYEMYLKFVAKFPSIENDWDLQLLPTTAVRSSSTAESYSRSSSLMESFVPFGGFFSTPDIKCSINSIYPDISNGHLQDSKFSKEGTFNLNRGLVSLVAGQRTSSVPSWLKVAGLSTNKNFESLKTESEEEYLIPSVAVISEKLDGTFSCLQQACPHDVTQVRPPPVPVNSGFYSLEDRKTIENESADLAFTNLSSLDFQLISMSNKNVSAHVSLETNKGSLPLAKPEKLQDPELPNFISPHNQSYTNGTFTGHSSSSSPSSVTTNLRLGIIPSSNWESETNQIGCLTGKFDVVTGSSNRSTRQSLSSEHHDYEKFKMLFRDLSQRVPLQREAVSHISRIVTGSQTASPKGIWLGFLGPDSRSKKKIAAALSEVLWRDHGSIVCTDLSSCHSMIDASNKDHRGKTIVDSIAEALSENPFSVVLLENVDRADVLVQSTLSSAVKTGKFLDSHGRDVSISNAIFVATSGYIKDEKCPFHLKEPPNLTKTKILKAKGLAFQMIHEQISRRTSRTTSNQTPTNKRKLVSVDMAADVQHESYKRPFNQSLNTQFDLNLPADVDDDDTHEVTDRLHSVGDNNHGQSPKSWLEHFMDQVDGIVEFKSFDTEGISEELVRKVTDNFHDIVGSDHLLEVDADVMDQFLAVVYTSDHPGMAEDWINSVLSKHLMEAKTRYDFTSPSVIKLANYNQVYAVEPVPGLPPSIIFN